MLLPKSVISFAMASGAKSNKIFGHISFICSGKKAERYSMMNSQTLGISSIATLLTGIVITLHNSISYFVPVYASIIDMPAQPRWTVRPRPFCASPPNSKALSGTEESSLVLLNLALCPLYKFATNITGNSKHPSLITPFGRTPYRAKMMPDSPNFPGALMNFLTTKLTRYFHQNHYSKYVAIYQ